MVPSPDRKPRIAGSGATRRSRQRLKAAERRDIILQAALQLFSERGFAASSTRELASRAGITEPVIYHYFASKEEVLAGVLDHFSFLPHLREFAEVEAPATLQERLLEFARNWHVFIRGRRPMLAVLLSEMSREPEMARRFRDVFHQALALLTRGASQVAAAKDVAPERLESAMRLFLSSLMWHLVVEERLGAEEDPLWEEHLASSVDLIVSALGD
jgi:AcrR family transcriptional regulator